MLLNLEFKTLNLAIHKTDKERFLDELEKLCEKYAGNDFAMSYESETINDNTGNCPECGAPLTDGDNWSGIKCTKCSYWFCF